MSPRPTYRDGVSGGGWLFITIAMPLDPTIGDAMIVLFLRMVVFFFEDRLHHEYYSYVCVIRHQAKIRGEHMRICVHAQTETPPANKITKKISKKQRWPSEKKKP